MTTLNGRHEPGDPVAGARDGVQAPVRPVLAGRGGLRQRAGLVVVALAATTVVAAGIGLAGRGTAPDPNRSAAAIQAPGSPDIATPSASSGNGPSPALTPDRACIPPDPSAPPEFMLRSTTGDGGPMTGARGPAAAPGATLPTTDWPVPPDSQAILTDRYGSLILLPPEGACVRRVAAEYVAVASPGDLPARLASVEFDVAVPRGRIVLRSPPSGDWVVRVEAAFSTGVGAVGTVVVTRFFRVTASGPQVTPLVTPAVPCAPVSTGAPPALSLRIGDRAPVRGIDPGTFPGDILRNGAVVEGTFPDRLELLVDGDACATSWTVEWLDHTGGGAVGGNSVENAEENPQYISQNRIELTEVPLGTTVVFATVRFGPGRTARAVWELTVAAPPPPAATVSGPDGQTLPGLPGCGTGWTIDGGPTGFETCFDYRLPEDLALLRIHERDIARLDVPGWRIQSWGTFCGTRSVEDPQAFSGEIGCELGGGAGGPAMFLPFPGLTVVQVRVTAERDGVIVMATYIVEILAEP